MIVLTRRPNLALAIVGALAIVLFLGGCAPTTTVARGSNSSVQEELVKQQSLAVKLKMSRQARMDAISWPILSANSELCESKKFRFGVKAASRLDVKRGLVKGWEKELGLTNDATIISVTRNSPADRGGLQAGDRLISIGGKKISSGRGANKKVRKLVDNLASAGESLEFVVFRPNGNETISSYLTPQQICNVEIVIVEDDSINAFTDGTNLYFNVGLIRFAESDWELQLVIAHELAHVIEGHIEKKMGNSLIGAVIDGLISGYSGTYSNTFSTIGATAFSQEFEREADYVGLYIMANSGLDTAEAANFWRRFAAEVPAANYNATTSYLASHPSAAERFTNIEATHQEIQTKIQTGQPLIPKRR